jgi:hypothetical protein
MARKKNKKPQVVVANKEKTNEVQPQRTAEPGSLTSKERRQLHRNTARQDSAISIQREADDDQVGDSKQSQDANPASDLSTQPDKSSFKCYSTLEDNGGTAKAVSSAELGHQVVDTDDSHKHSATTPNEM